MEKPKPIDNLFGVERDKHLVRLNGLHYKMKVDEAVNLAAHLITVLGDKREELEKALESLGQ